MDKLLDMQSVDDTVESFDGMCIMKNKENCEEIFNNLLKKQILKILENQSFLTTKQVEELEKTLHSDDFPQELIQNLFPCIHSILIKPQNSIILLTSTYVIDVCISNFPEVSNFIFDENLFEILGQWKDTKMPVMISRILSLLNSLIKGQCLLIQNQRVLIDTFFQSILYWGTLKLEQIEKSFSTTFRNLIIFKFPFNEQELQDIVQFFFQYFDFHNQECSHGQEYSHNHKLIVSSLANFLQLYQFPTKTEFADSFNNSSFIQHLLSLSQISKFSDVSIFTLQTLNQYSSKVLEPKVLEFLLNFLHICSSQSFSQICFILESYFDNPIIYSNRTQILYTIESRYSSLRFLDKKGSITFIAKIFSSLSNEEFLGGEIFKSFFINVLQDFSTHSKLLNLCLEFMERIGPSFSKSLISFYDTFAEMADSIDYVTDNRNKILQKILKCLDSLEN